MVNLALMLDYLGGKMKTPEELAEEWLINNQAELMTNYDAFLTGYKAAQEHAHAALEEAEVKIDRLETNTHGWISVKDRLPEIPENGYSNRVLLLRADGFIVIAKLEKCVRFVRPLQEALIVETDNGDPIEEFTHWQELPEPPKEEE